MPHGIGFVWATILWDVTWDMIDAHGWNANLYNATGTAGNQMMLRLVTEGMKLTPCNPGFVDARNAIIAADNALFNGVHYTTLWAAFARRGLGWSASQGATNSNADNTQAFDTPPPQAAMSVTPGTVTAAAAPGATTSASVVVANTAAAGAQTLTYTAAITGATYVTGPDAPQSARLPAPAPEPGGDAAEGPAGAVWVSESAGAAPLEGAPAPQARAEAPAGAPPSDQLAVGCTGGQQLQQTAAVFATTVTSGGQELGQSFTAPCTGTLTVVSPLFNWGRSPNTTFNATVRVYAGAGTTGGLLNASAFTFTNLASGVNYLNITLSSPVPMTQGAVYTWFLDMTAGSTGMQFSNVNPLAGGNLYFTTNGNPVPATSSPTEDMQFLLTFGAPAPWVTVSPAGGNVAPGASNTLGLNFNAAGLAAGTYTATLAISSNAPAASAVNVPITFVVRAASQQIAGRAGWRMMAAPTTAMTVAHLASQNLVQGVPGYYPTNNPNLYTAFNGTSWVPATGASQVVGGGTGFMWYFFNQNVTGSGGSSSVALPMTIAAPAGAAEPTGNVAVPLHAANTKWNLVGNPYMTGLDVSSMGTWASGGTLASAVAQVWDPNAGASGSYLLSTINLGNTIAPWQGFLIQNNTATTLTIPAGAKLDSGTFHSHEALETRIVAFELESASAASGQTLYDRAIALYFHPDATAAWDLWDASKLTPLSSAYALLAFEGSRDGQPVLKAQESRPIDPTAPFDVPMALEAVGTAPSLTLPLAGADEPPGDVDAHAGGPRDRRDDGPPHGRPLHVRRHRGRPPHGRGRRAAGCRLARGGDDAVRAPREPRRGDGQRPGRAPGRVRPRRPGAEPRHRRGRAPVRRAGGGRRVGGGVRPAGPPRGGARRGGGGGGPPRGAARRGRALGGGVRRADAAGAFVQARRLTDPALTGGRTPPVGARGAGRRACPPLAFGPLTPSSCGRGGGLSEVRRAAPTFSQCPALGGLSLVLLPTMKRIATLALLAGLLGATSAVAQTLTASDAPVRTAIEHVAGRARAQGAAPADVADLAVTYAYTDAPTGISHVYLRQRLGGIEVAGSEVTVGVGRDGRVFHTAGAVVPGAAAQARATRALGAAAAVAAAAAHVGVPTPALTVADVAAGADLRTTYETPETALAPLTARLVYHAAEGAPVRLAWEVGPLEGDGASAWMVRVDAQTGAELWRADLVAHDTWGVTFPGVDLTHPQDALAPWLLNEPAGTAATPDAYRVFAAPLESPSHGARTLATNPADLTASPFGWHDTNGVAGAEFTITRGNNTHAYLDAVGDDAPDAGADVDGGATLVFDFPLDLTQAPSTYRPAAITNVFYWTNIVHDIAYRYGFTEAARNFQVNNYGRGGAGADDVRAQAQDGSVGPCENVNGCFNNANFGTSADGNRPRMQMYLFNQTAPFRDGDFDAGIITHEIGHGVSNRLVNGGSMGCLNNNEQMGEGWSDFYGLMLTMRVTDTRTTNHGVGTYPYGQPITGDGIRPAPYNTSFAVNDFTYQDSRTQSVPHGVGFVWTTILWEVTWDLIDAHGFSADLYNPLGGAGNQIMLRLVTEGLKLTGCNPGFVTGRDAILAADAALYPSGTPGQGTHYALLWNAFARRGLGLGATQGSTGSNADNTEAFNTPLAAPSSTITPTSIVAAIVPNGTTTATVTLTNTAAVGSADLNFTSYVENATVPLTGPLPEAAAPPAETAARAPAAPPWPSPPDDREAPAAVPAAGQPGLPLAAPAVAAPTDDLAPVACVSGQELAQEAVNFRGPVTTGGQEWGQSFTAPCTGFLSTITPAIDYTAFPNALWGATMRLYAGAGTGGTELATVPFTYTNGGGTASVFLNVPLPSPVAVTQGAVYTWFMDMTSGSTEMHYTTSSVYAGGSQYRTTNGAAGSAVAVPAQDLRFRLTFAPAVTWISANTTGGHAPTGTSRTVTLSFNGAGLAAGTYTATLEIDTNDPANASVDIPVTLVVRAASQQIAGAAGWRMMAAPTTTMTVADLAEPEPRPGRPGLLPLGRDEPPHGLQRHGVGAGDRRRRGARRRPRLPVVLLQPDHQHRRPEQQRRPPDDRRGASRRRRADGQRGRPAPRGQHEVEPRREPLHDRHQRRVHEHVGHRGHAHQRRRAGVGPQRRRERLVPPHDGHGEHGRPLAGLLRAEQHGHHADDPGRREARQRHVPQPRGAGDPHRRVRARGHRRRLRPDGLRPRDRAVLPPRRDGGVGPLGRLEARPAQLRLRAARLRGLPRRAARPEGAGEPADRPHGAVRRPDGAGGRRHRAVAHAPLADDDEPPGGRGRSRWRTS